jgi:predicted negative regulator of RcsB-dependent stress response
VPTSIAFLRLGDIAVRQGRRDDAVQYYRTAAEAGGNVAAEAKQKLAELTAN